MRRVREWERDRKRGEGREKMNFDGKESANFN